VTEQAESKNPRHSGTILENRILIYAMNAATCGLATLHNWHEACDFEVSS
jgi:hypothetical protein